MTRCVTGPLVAVVGVLVAMSVAAGGCSTGTPARSSSTTTTIAKAPVAARAQSVIAACGANACSAPTPNSTKFCESYDIQVVATLSSIGIRASGGNVFLASQVSAPTSGPRLLRCEYSGKLSHARIGFDIVVEEPVNPEQPLCARGLRCTHLTIAAGADAVSTGAGSYAVSCSNGWRFFVSSIGIPLAKALPLLRYLNSSLTRSG